MELQKIKIMELQKIESFPVSKREISNLAEEFISHIKAKQDEGQENAVAIKGAITISAIEAFLKEVKSNPLWRDLVLNELSEDTTIKGSTVSLKEAGVTYQYKGCSSRWDELDKKIKEMSEEKKKLEEKMRIAYKGATIIDEATGEVLGVPLKKSTSTYAVSLKK